MATILVLASLLAVVFGQVRVNILPKVLAHENQQETCSVELLEGSFSYAVQALTLFPPPTSPPTSPSQIGAYAPFAFGGTIHFDGQGNLRGADVVNFGFGGVPRTFSGTYAVADPKANPSDCAFTSTFTDTLGNTIHTYMVVASHGNVLKLVTWFLTARRNESATFIIKHCGRICDSDSY
jgi:hypothetical protein